MEISLNKLIGHQIIVMGPPFIEQEKPASVKLLAVEEAGIWIGSQEAVANVMEKFRAKPSSAGLAFFLPFSQIVTILAGFDSADLE